jgi:hypothetical protein
MVEVGSKKVCRFFMRVDLPAPILASIEMMVADFVIVVCLGGCTNFGK